LPPLLRIKDEEGEDPPIYLEDLERLGLVRKDAEVKEEFIVRPLIQPRSKPEVESPDPLTFVGRAHPGFDTVEQRMAKRHQKRHQAFRNRRRQVNQGVYKERQESSPMLEQIEWERVEKGSPLWIERKNHYWKSGIARTFVPWPVKADVKLEQMGERRE
jgi:hypothetical protein